MRVRTSRRATGVGMALLAAGTLAFAQASAVAQQSAQESAPESALESHGLRATWGPAQREAEIGEPVRWSLEVTHPRRQRPRLVAQDLAARLDRGWALVAGPEIRTRADRAQSEVSTFTWTLLALEPGERVAPDLVLSTDSGQEIAVASETLTVGGALAPDEDAPRPLASFHDIEPPGGRGFAVLVALAGVVAALVAWIVLRAVQRRRLRPAAALVIPPRAALDELAAQRSDDPQRVRALAFELTGLLRRALQAGEPGATDEEWLAAARANGRIAPTVIETAERVVGTCQEIKYGGRVPTRFAVDELLSSARAVVDGLETPREVVA